MTNNQLWNLIARKLSGEASLDEIRLLDQIVSEDPELAYRVELFSRYFEHPAVAERSQADRQLSWDHFNARLQEENAAGALSPERRKWFRSAPIKKYWIAAAALAACTLLVVMLFKSAHQDAVSVPATRFLEMNTMPGSRSKTMLPDGTEVWLNSDSRISYNAEFGVNKREITLVGEAFFDVAHNEKVPLIVHAKSVNILVKGTAFNVRSYPDSRDVETSLIRGLVELSTNADPEKKIILKPNEKISIEAEPLSLAVHESIKVHPPSTQKLYHIDTLKESRISNTIPEVSWIENKLVFDNETFSAIIGKMEKWYNVEITLTNDSLALKKFSGAFEKENLYEALNALQFINHFDFEIKGKQVFIK